MLPHDFWQEIHPPKTFSTDGEFRDFYVAELPDGRQLQLPIRVLAVGEQALASLIINQASFAVQHALADALASSIAEYKIDVVAGLPTLGLTLAGAVAQALGHRRYVPLGTSRKFWYRDDLSVPLSSI
ncbi:MAG: phosphoribosyltransferase, partial [Rhizobiaceae bacterium]|nr:phosphoribosyltransferase [Rhizobiaceae bacterium]